MGDTIESMGSPGAVTIDPGGYRRHAKFDYSGWLSFFTGVAAGGLIVWLWMI